MDNLENTRTRQAEWAVTNLGDLLSNETKAQLQKIVDEKINNKPDDISNGMSEVQVPTDSQDSKV